jgi:AraC-like DNA-binding protein
MTEVIGTKYCCTSGVGEGWNREVLRFRLCYACKLLEERPTKAIAEMVYNCGSSDPGNLIERFRWKYRMTPKSTASIGPRKRLLGNRSFNQVEKKRESFFHLLTAAASYFCKLLVFNKLNFAKRTPLR